MKRRNAIKSLAALTVTPLLPAVAIEQPVVRTMSGMQAFLAYLKANGSFQFGKDEQKMLDWCKANNIRIKTKAD